MVDETLPKQEVNTGPPAVEKPKKNRSRLIIAGIIIAILAIVPLAFFTLSVHPDLPPEKGVPYPYTMTYWILLPEGKLIQIADTPIIALTAGNEMILKIGEKTEKFVVGDTKTITERKAEFRVLGIPLLSTNYLIDATYRGPVNNNAEFSLIVRTSKQVPSFLIERILPAEIQATPA